MKHYACDLEATTPPEDRVYSPSEAKQLTTEAYLIGAMNVDDTDEFHCFHNMDDFMYWVLAQDNCNFDWFNSSGYDGNFIIYWLMQHGFNSSKSRVIEDSDETPGLWVGDEGKFTVYKLDEQYIRGAWNFIDVMPLMSGSIRMHGDALGYPKGETPLVPYGKKLTDLQKANGEYWTMAEGEAYLRRDCEILARQMKEWSVPEFVENAILTISQLANQAVRKELPDPRHAFKRRDEFRVVQKLRYNDDSITKIAPPRANSQADRLPTGERLKLEVVNANIKNAYKGGFNWVNPRYADTWVSDGVVLDINSMYPSIYMGKLRLEGYDFTLASRFVRAVGSLDAVADDEQFIVEYKHLWAKIKHGHVPIIKPRTDDTQHSGIAGFNEDGSYRANTYGDIGFKSYDTANGESVCNTMMLTSIEHQYLEQHYEIMQSEISKVYVLAEDKSLTRKFREHGERWMRMKVEAGKGTSDYNFAKLMLNTPYGKLGEQVKLYPHYQWEITADDVPLKTKGGSDEGGNPISDLAMACFITAAGRVYLGESINKIGLDRFLYCDTDSMHILGDDVNGLDIDDTRVGAWSVEDTFTEGLFIKCKTYGEMINGERWKTTTAGISGNIPKESFGVGSSVTTLRSYFCKGGTILVQRQITIGSVASSVFKPKEMRANEIAADAGGSESFEELLKGLKRTRSELF